MTGLAPTHRIFKRHSTSPAASRRSASEPPRVTLVPAPSARNDPGLTPGAAASVQTQSHDSPARRRRMGRAARNASQRAQTMGFAQLNPSYWDTGTSSFQTAECDLDLHGRNHHPLPILPHQGGRAPRRATTAEQRQRRSHHPSFTISRGRRLTATPWKAQRKRI